jgi:hypothetical protein
MAVAKSFQSLIQQGEPYSKNGKKYVKLLNEKTGTVREARWYTDEEYAKLYPEDKKTAAAPVSRSQKQALGFEKGYITIFRGDTYSNLDWFQQSIARYARLWGWYIVSTDEVPADLPEGITPVQLNWESVGLDNGTLKPETQVKEAVEAVIYEPTVSEFVGEVGERLDLTLTITAVRQIDGNYGVSTAHVMEDEDGNMFSWITASKSWAVGTVKKIRGTVKEHKIWRNSKITYLTRCAEVK